ncbi:MAG: 16S rRNA (adenine(1518)-N(6)/adenine(1519)-N(6))-dimethyltransferase RsmA [Acidobacteriota bacterium]
MSFWRVRRAGQGILALVSATDPQRSRPRLKKRFGQHHLTRPELCRPLLRFLEPEDATVIEVGPGGGVLTGALRATGARVWALEVDVDWIGHLASRARRDDDLALVGLDALDFPWHRLRAPVRVTGNLPFNVGTPIIDAVLSRSVQHPELVPRSAFMVQKEVAERLVAKPGERAYGGLSVTVAARARARLLGTVAPGAFRPPPKVAAAFVGFVPRPPALDLARLPCLFAVVRAAFASRRKTLRNTLGSAYGRGPADAALAAAGIDPGRRAETVALDEFIHLTHELETADPPR